MSDLLIASLTAAHKDLKKMVLRLERRIGHLEEKNRILMSPSQGEVLGKVQGSYQAPAGEKPTVPTTGSGVVPSSAPPQGDFPRSVGDMKLGPSLSDESMS